MREIDEARAEINAERGEGVIVRGNELQTYNLIPTGIFVVDYATFGGVPDGRGTTFFGVENSGKSFMLYMTIASYQRKYPDGVALLIDLEHMYDPLWAAALGVDNDKLDYSRPKHGQEAADIVKRYMDAWECGLVAVDTLAAMVPLQEEERSVEDYGMGERAALISKMINKIYLSWAAERKRDHWVTVLFANQYRDKIGATKYENPYKEPGGWQQKYFAQCKVLMKRRDAIAKGAKEPHGNIHTFTLTKQKGASLKTGEFEVNMLPDHPYLKRGEVDEYKQVATIAKLEGVITGNPKKYVVEPWGESTFNKVDDIIEVMVNDPESRELLKQSTIIAHREKYGLPALPPDGYLLDWAGYE